MVARLGSVGRLTDQRTVSAYPHRVDGSLGGIPLRTPDGEPTSLAQFRDGWLVLQLVRYFGCLPCQEWLIELDRRRTALAELGVQVAAVGGSADYQARWLASERAVTMPLLLDPEQSLRAALDLGIPLGWRLLDPRGLASYATNLARGRRPQAITHDTVRSPAVVVLDPGLVPRWRFEGRRIGDYPSHAAVVTAVQRLLAGT